MQCSLRQPKSHLNVTKNTNMHETAFGSAINYLTMCLACKRFEKVNDFVYLLGLNLSAEKGFMFVIFPKFAKSL